MKLLLAITALIALLLAFKADRRAYDATRAFDSAREQLEALERTRSGHIDPAYTCLKR